VRVRICLRVSAIRTLMSASVSLTDVVPSHDALRLAPATRSKQGAVWSRVPVDYENWMVELKFLITGRYV
jgi:hypothetical protein